MSVGGTGECLAIEGSTIRTVFEAYLVQVFLVPSLEPGQVMVMDNLSAHPDTLGHTTVAITLDTYSHMILGMGPRLPR